MAIDDADEFVNKKPELTPENIALIQQYLAEKKRPRLRSKDPSHRVYRYGHVESGSVNAETGEVQINCKFPGCTAGRWVFIRDVFQVDTCEYHGALVRAYNRQRKAEKLQQTAREMGLTEDIEDQDQFMDKWEELGAHFSPAQIQMLRDWEAKEAARKRCESCGEMVDPDEMDIHGPNKCDQRECQRCGTPHRCVRLECFVSNDQPITEELGGIRPAHILVKAKNDSSWIEYSDDEGNLKYMQVHDVRSARDSYGRWVVYGVDQEGKPVQELYDLRHSFEHSHTFDGVRELMFGEVVKLAKRGVIKGANGKPIESLADLMKIADEPLRRLIMKKAKEAKTGGPSLDAINKQMFGEPKTSAQRRTGKTGARPWPTSTSS